MKKLTQEFSKGPASKYRCALEEVISLTMNSNRSKSDRKDISNQKEITPASPLYVVDDITKTQPPLLKVRFTFKQRLLLTTLFAFGLLFCSTCYPGGPDILKVTATPHSFGKRWEMTKSAQLRSLAMLIEMYPEHEIYFLDRDARLLGQTALLIGDIENEPTLKKRVHFLNVSRNTMTDPLLPEYLKQEGISEESLLKNKKILFVDTGFQGTIPRKIMQLFPSHAENMEVHMVLAAPLNREYRSPFASMRVFGTEFYPTYPNQDYLESGLDVVHPYARLPKSDLRSDYYSKDPNGKITPQSRPGTFDPNDGEINYKKTTEHEEDLNFFMKEPGSRLLTDKLRREWRSVFKLWEAGNKPDTIKLLQQWVNHKGAQGLAMALDFMEMIHTTKIGSFTITPADLGTTHLELNSNNKRLEAKNLPLWNPRNCRNILKQLNH